MATIISALLLDPSTIITKCAKGRCMHSRKSAIIPWSYSVQHQCRFLRHNVLILTMGFWSKFAHLIAGCINFCPCNNVRWVAMFTSFLLIVPNSIKVSLNTNTLRFRVVVCPMQCMTLDIYKIIRVFVCLSVCPKYLPHLIATEVFFDLRQIWHVGHTYNNEE